jgi:hypothetical protein
MVARLFRIWETNSGFEIKWDLVNNFEMNLI